MLRARSPVRTLTHEDRDEALELCARHPDENVFVAARILEGALQRNPGSLVGVREDGRLVSVAWASANLVPVETTPDTLPVIAAKVRRLRHRCASVLGPRDQVVPLWELLEPAWGPPRAVRLNQPVMSIDVPPSALGVPIDRRVRRALPAEIDLVLPAAEHMFTAEIGYPPYTGSDRGYRAALMTLLEQGHTFVVLDGGRVVFKADVGSVGVGCAQLQGVWLAPHLRGRGLAVPAMAAVVEQVLHDIAPRATLYVNDFNHAARATYRRIGMRDVGEFSTILL